MRLLLPLAVFFGSLILTTIACTVGWEILVKSHLYNCTDDFPLDYWKPGQWVHHPVVVPHVTKGRSMSEPDTIKRGWSVSGLWRLWQSLVAGSLAISVFLTSLTWSMSRGLKHLIFRTQAT